MIVRKFTALLALTTLTFCLQIRGSEPYEPPPQYKVTDVIPPDVTPGELFQIDDTVVASNFYYYFHVASKFGNYEVASVNLLRTRAHEIEVLTQNPDDPGTGEFADSVKTELTANAKGVVKAVAAPVKTVKAVATGIKRDSQNAIDMLFRKNRNQPKEAFFIGEERRKLACAVGLDLYSTNPAVQDFLTAHAKARTAGTTFVSVSFSITTTVVPVLSPVGWAISAGKYRDQAYAKVDTLSAIDLYRYNDDLLKSMDVDKELRVRFLEYPDFTPRQKTEIVAALKSLEKLSDKNDFIAAVQEFHPVEGIWPVECAAMLAKFDNAGDAVTSVSASGPALSARSVSGKDVVVFPADVLYWNYDAAKVFESFAPGKADGQRVCVVSGQITSRARAELEKRGFVVHERYLFDAAPAAPITPTASVAPAAEATSNKIPESRAEFHVAHQGVD